jgi:hypothetical protein
MAAMEAGAERMEAVAAAVAVLEVRPPEFIAHATECSASCQTPPLYHESMGLRLPDMTSACHHGADRQQEPARMLALCVASSRASGSVHQDCEACNAGRGSNLTLGGVVECDASVTDDEGAFGAVAAVPGVISQDAAASHLVVLQSRSNSRLVMVPCLVVAVDDRADVLHMATWRCSCMPHGGAAAHAG